ncbi:pentapeptide repeat-containing protein [Streptomyces sp. SudanB25_2051]|uniref:pentapeptide repeat-containing protein n=1 Tax=Streptomyces sp. SudanB25_2051 TaxID=3035275 RepID=UPI003F54B254
MPQPGNTRRPGRPSPLPTTARPPHHPPRRPRKAGRSAAAVPVYPLYDAGLSRADPTRANLTSANLDDTALLHADLTGADLTGEGVAHMGGSMNPMRRRFTPSTRCGGPFLPVSGGTSPAPAATGHRNTPRRCGNWGAAGGIPHGPSAGREPRGAWARFPPGHAGDVRPRGRRALGRTGEADVASRVRQRRPFTPRAAASADAGPDPVRHHGRRGARTRGSDGGTGGGGSSATATPPRPTRPAGSSRRRRSPGGGRER